MIRKLLLSGTYIATVLLLVCFLSGYALAAGSSGVVEVSKLEMVIKIIELKTGQSRILNVTVSPGTADDKRITWSSSDESVATVRTSAGSGSATVTAVGEGRAKITATSNNGKTAVCSVTVSDDEVEVRRIRMITETATIKVNQMKALSVEFSPRNADDKTIIWSSGNPAVAVVEDDGTVVGKSQGTAEITATSANGKTAVCTVTVTLPALTETGRQASGKDIVVEDSEKSVSGNISMAIGKEKDLSEYIKYKEWYTDNNGELRTQWQLVGAISWTSAFPDIVSINDKGIAVAHRAGTSRITATGRDETGQKHVQTIIVGVSSGISASPANSFEISEGVWLDLRQIGELHSGAKNIKWSSSVLDIASVDSEGLVLARSIGRCDVTASYIDENNAKQEIKYQLRVTAGILNNKTKNSTIILNPGDKIDLGKMYYPNYQNLPSALKQYYCTTGAQNILSVDSLSVLAKAAGTGSISIRKTDGTDETICHKLTIVVKK